MKFLRCVTAVSVATFTLAGCSSSADSTAESAVGSQQGKTSYSDGQKATVKSVDSGNTVAVDINGEQKQVRLINVVAPSKNNNAPSGTCLLRESQKFLAEKLPADKEITLNFDPSQPGTSGFLEAAVYDGDDFINQEVVAAGFAATSFTTQKDKFYPDISKTQQSAAKDGVGLYSTDTDCSIPHKIKSQIEAVNRAKDEPESNEEMKAKHRQVYQIASNYYNELVKAQESPASYVGSIVTLDAVKAQLEDLQKALGDDYFDEHGESVADKASASATATARPGGN
ncbi:MAG: thermonuclease family protein [Rothia sp. (in: high G+C Gram-positive bacteria)]|nr:thermonuclease family protein [Rothia sp. (in: high G+C Gram-positive bacteria)]